VDIPLLANHILRRLCAARDIHPVNMSKSTMKILLNFDYPGNIRELENILDHALIISRETEIFPQHLPDYIRRPANPGPPPVNNGPGYAGDKHAAERKKILDTLAAHRGNRAKTAQALGINRTTLWRKMKRYQLL